MISQTESNFVSHRTVDKFIRKLKYSESFKKFYAPLKELSVKKTTVPRMNHIYFDLWKSFHSKILHSSSLDILKYENPLRAVKTFLIKDKCRFCNDL